MQLTNVSMAFFSLIVMSLAQIAFAEDAVSDWVGQEPCVTSTGIPGAVFVGFYNTVSAPSGFETVAISGDNGVQYRDRTVSNGNFWVFPDLKIERDILVQTEEYVSQSEQAELRFENFAGKLIGSCWVEAVDFDPSIHDLASISMGFCAFDQENGFSQIAAGNTETYRLPASADEIGISPSGVLDSSRPDGARQITMTAKGNGVASFVWASRAFGERTLMGVCPFLVTDHQ